MGESSDGTCGLRVPLMFAEGGAESHMLAGIGIFPYRGRYSVCLVEEVAMLVFDPAQRDAGGGWLESPG
jgi:hypothetical protein